MNKLEKAICASVRRAHITYRGITDDWLWHAPEHYLQNYIFRSLGRKHEVYAEASRRRIAVGMDRSPLGRPPTKEYRYDLVVWHRTSWRLRAVIEIKRSWGLDRGLRNDADRVFKALKGAQKATAGYVLVYSEARVKKGGKIALVKKFRRWSSQLGMAILNANTMILEVEDGTDGWVCGFVLMRAKKT